MSLSQMGLLFLLHCSPTASRVKQLLGVVFLGWMFIWVMTPTKTYANVWLPKIQSKTNSIYFGIQGSNLLIYTFPILFISVLGCYYLHRVTATNNVNTGKPSCHLEVWKRPMLTKGCLGVLSATELVFCLMFVALVIWSLSMYMSNSFNRIDVQSAKSGMGNKWKDRLASAGLQLGLVGKICFSFLFIPVARGCSILPLVGLTSESSIRYHIWLGHIVMLLFTAHGLCYVVLWAATDQISKHFVKWSTNGYSAVAGLIALLSGLAMWATTLPRIRRKAFELFFYTHQLYVLYLLFYLLHVGISSFSIVLPGVYLFLVDRCLRLLQSRQKVRLISARILPSEAVELNFSKTPGLRYAAASIVFINIPSISKLQWHPFTVSSSSNLEPEKLSVIIKKEGKWTQKLYQELNKSLFDSLNVSVEGPYGPASVDFQRYETLVMVSGGSGITPFISIIREFLYRSSLGSPTPDIILVSVFKTVADLTMLDLLLPDSGNIYNLSLLHLKVEAYVTQETASCPAGTNQIRSISFKPNPSHVPVAPVLGQNSWLWLAAVISSSFAAYLVLLGILTRFYIHSVEERTGNYSETSRTLFSLFFLCGCIVAASSAAFLWNKTRNNTDVSVVDFSDGNLELESDPKESLRQATTVHFGGRPDLTSILSGINRSSVGVMVSGPSGLCSDVAAICSSGLAKNLHFESISYRW